jgi:hypothetical protein
MLACHYRPHRRVEARRTRPGDASLSNLFGGRQRRFRDGQAKPSEIQLVRNRQRSLAHDFVRIFGADAFRPDIGRRPIDDVCGPRRCEDVFILDGEFQNKWRPRKFGSTTTLTGRDNRFIFCPCSFARLEIRLVRSRHGRLPG